VTVVDASAAVKWFLPEIGSEAAAELLENSVQLYAPDLIRIEVTAAITRKMRLGQIAPEIAERLCLLWLQSLEEKAVFLLDSAELLIPAMKLALEIRHPLQDCLYLAAAREMKAPLITADKTFWERAKGIYHEISMLPGLHTN